MDRLAWEGRWGWGRALDLLRDRTKGRTRPSRQSRAGPHPPGTLNPGRSSMPSLLLRVGGRGLPSCMEAAHSDSVCGAQSVSLLGVVHASCRSGLFSVELFILVLPFPPPAALPPFSAQGLLRAISHHLLPWKLVVRGLAGLGLTHCDFSLEYLPLERGFLTVCRW